MQLTYVAVTDTVYEHNTKEHIPLQQSDDLTQTLPRPRHASLSMEEKMSIFDLKMHNSITF